MARRTAVTNVLVLALALLLLSISIAPVCSEEAAHEDEEAGHTLIEKFDEDGDEQYVCCPLPMNQMFPSHHKTERLPSLPTHSLNEEELGDMIAAAVDQPGARADCPSAHEMMEHADANGDEKLDEHETEAAAVMLVPCTLGMTTVETVSITVAGKAYTCTMHTEGDEHGDTHASHLLLRRRLEGEAGEAAGADVEWDCVEAKVADDHDGDGPLSDASVWGLSLVAAGIVSLAAIIGILFLLPLGRFLIKYGQDVEGFAIGALLGGSILHSFPEAVALSGGFSWKVSISFLGGFLGSVLLEHILRLHQSRHGKVASAASAAAAAAAKSSYTSEGDSEAEVDAAVARGDIEQPAIEQHDHSGEGAVAAAAAGAGAVHSHGDDNEDDTEADDHSHAFTLADLEAAGPGNHSGTAAADPPSLDAGAGAGMGAGATAPKAAAAAGVSTASEPFGEFVSVAVAEEVDTGAAETPAKRSSPSDDDDEDAMALAVSRSSKPLMRHAPSAASTTTPSAIVARVGGGGANSNCSATTGKADGADGGAATKRTKTPIAAMAYVVTAGDLVHNIVDGFVIAAAFRSCSSALGWSVTLAVICHEVPQELSDFLILRKAGLSYCQALFVNVMTALGSLLGVVAVLLMGNNPLTNAYLLAFSSGVLIYLAATDLLPPMLRETSWKRAAIRFFIILVGIALIGILQVYHPECHAANVVEGVEDAHAGH